jgi:tRNA (cytidine32/guanosine34-2'-O)-methyltransferase
VLVEGEKFGRVAWLDQEAATRAQLLRLQHASVGAGGEAPRGEALERPTATAAGTMTEDKTKTAHDAAPKKQAKIVSIDLQPMSPLPGVTTLRADITHPATVPLLLNALDPDASDRSSDSHRVDLVLSDGAPDVTGLHDLDIYIQSQLLFAALNLALCVLRPGGRFVAKIFRARNVDLLYAQLGVFFDRVVVAKPRSSRASSVEAFIVCLGFRPPPGFEASLERPLGVSSSGLDEMVREQRRAHPIIASRPVQDGETGAWGVIESSIAGSTATGGDYSVVHLDAHDETGDGLDDKATRWIAPFVACGDLSSFDADASYRLPENYVSLDPVQPPTAPPYKRAVELRKAAGGAYGKTGIRT